MSNYEAVKQAFDIYKRKDALDEFGKEDAVALLGSQGLWSQRQMSAITGATPFFVAQRNTKTDTTGGKFNPQTFDLLLEAIELYDAGETNRHLLRRIFEAGTSVFMMSRLIGIPVSTIQWNIKRAKGEN